MGAHRLRRFCLVILLGEACGFPRAGWAEVKLYLKDGTYQLVKSYEVHGDRVRYYTIERSQWEEIPTSLVDFDATKRVQQEEKTEQQKVVEEAKQVDKERFQRVKADEGFEVAPGLHLPRTEGVYAFDGSRVIPMIQSSAEIVTDKKRAALNMVLPPILKNRSLAVLPGAQAALRIFATQPSFYAQFDDGAGANLLLVTVKPTKENRVVEKVERSSLGGGKASEVRTQIPLERSQIAPNLFRLRPVQPLEKGEYAFGELIGEKLNLEVWDFGIGGVPKTEQPSSSDDSNSPPRPHLPIPGLPRPRPQPQPQPQQPQPQEPQP